MSEQILITLPKLGESIVSATIIQWFKKAGDTVALDEPLLEVSTDKVNSEIPSPAAGVLMEILALPCQEVQVGETLAILSTTAAKKHAEPIAAAAPSFYSEPVTLDDAVDTVVNRILDLAGFDNDGFKWQDTKGTLV